MHNRNKRDARCSQQHPYLSWDGTGFCCNSKPDVNKPSKRKAVFLAGGPGSGKSFVASFRMSGVSLKNLGFKTINSDDDFEAALKQNKIEMTPENIFSPRGQNIRARTKRYTDEKFEKAQKAGLGLVIDGTGKNFSKIKQQKQKLEKLGYQTWLVFVATSLDVAKKRNQMRARSLPDAEVETFWNEVMANKGKLKTLFGSHFHMIHNETLVESKKQFEHFLKNIRNKK